MENLTKRRLLRIGLWLGLSGAAAGTAVASRANCWMTGGGSIFAPEMDASYAGSFDRTGRITHGFVLHCTPQKSDNLEIVDHESNLNFHLDTVTSANCIDDPSITPNPPDANFDTFIGIGTGRCKLPGGQDFACTARWTFTDGGERGGCIRDSASIVITDTNGSVVSSVMGDVDCGNHQAHSN